MENNSHFIHEPLQSPSLSFRLLTILPAGFSEANTIYCRLTIWPSVEEARHLYETVSYVWGGQQPTEVIWIDQLVFTVTPNVKRLLLCLRHSSDERTVWIDSICINQTDIQEKQYQLPLMSKIYRNGMQNCIFLGPTDDDERDHSETYCLALDTATQLKAKEISALQLPQESAGFQALDKIFSHPWFRRIWVIQETVLPRQNIFVCGQEVLLFGELEDASMRLHHALDWTAIKFTLSGVFTDAAIRGIGIMANFFILRQEYAYLHDSQHNPEPRDLAVLLETNTVRSATNHHDRVYGLLGLLSSSIEGQPLPKALVPNYATPLPEVYLQATREAIDSRRDLFVLRSVFHPHEDMSNLQGYPSWVPRWNMKENHLGRPKRPAHFYNACYRKFEDKHEAQGDNPNVLTWRGVTIGNVASLTPIFTPQILDDTTLLSSAFSFVESLASTVEHDTDEESINAGDALARTLIGGVSHFREASTEEIYRFHEFRRRLRAGDRLDALDGDALSYYRLLLSACCGNRFFLTSTGSIGLAPFAIRKDDTVAILYNCSWPVILRHLGVDRRYHLIGVAYVDGLMDGRAMKEHVESERADRVFEIH